MSHHDEDPTVDERPAADAGSREHDSPALDPPATGGERTASDRVLFDPSGKNYWDGHAWQAVPGGQRSVSRRTLVVAAAVVIVLALLGAAIAVVATGGSSPESEAERKFVTGLEKAKFVPDHLSPTARRAMISFGHQVCDDYKNGMTLHEVGKKYSPSRTSAMFGSPGTVQQDRWLRQTAHGVTQILLVLTVAATAPLALCPQYKDVLN